MRINVLRNILAVGLALGSSFFGGESVAEVIVVGSEGLSWEGGGGGEIQALVIRGANAVERTNAPGGVINFRPVDRVNWIFPQRADTTVNISQGADSQERGGSIWSPNNISVRSSLSNLIDDNAESALDLKPDAGEQAVGALGLIIDLDLGARFGVDRFKFFPRNADPDFPAPDFPFQKSFLRAYEIFINDGTKATQVEGVRILSTAVVENQNEDSVVDIRIPPQYVRHVRLKSLASTGFEIAEFQVFGTGFVPEARYVSNIFDFEDLALLGKLRWVEEKMGDSGLSRAQVRTRTGIDAQPVEFTKIRPGEQIFRSGGGSVDDSGAWIGGTTATNLEVPWKWAEDVDDPDLKELIETVLDNEQVDARQAQGEFKALPLDQQAEITIDESYYNALKSQDQGNLTDDVTNWSAWSPPYPLEGVVEEGLLSATDLGTGIVSPGPRRYFQFMVEFESEDFDAATGVGGLAFEAITPPFAEELLAEIAPRTVQLGAKTRFVYAVLNKSRAGQARGFDQLHIDTPLRVEQLGRLEIRLPDGAVNEADFSGVSLEGLPVRQGDFSVIEVDDAGFTISFPRIVEENAVLKVEFDNAVLRFGTIFTGQGLDSESGSVVGQEVVAGNAADLQEDGVEDGDLQPLGVSKIGNLSVAVPIARDLLTNARAEPPVFSPNGDGINDRAQLNYDITNIASPTPLTIKIYDLAGRLVRRLYDADDISGRYAHAWDGKNGAGELVSPGHYLFTIELEAGTGNEREVGLVSVVY